MQIDLTEGLCPGCGAEALEFFAVLHHLPCAYVGPAYDFLVAAGGYVCPKCRRDIPQPRPMARLWERAPAAAAAVWRLWYRRPPRRYPEAHAAPPYTSAAVAYNPSPG